MRICFVAHQATKEGAGRFMLDQAEYLVARGVAVFAILPTEGPLYDELSKHGVQVRVIANPWWTRAMISGREPDYVSTLDSARRMAAAFREWAIDVVYTQTVVVPAGAVAAALSGLPHIWHIHEFSYNPGAIEMAIPKQSLARLIDLTSNVVFFNSKAVAAEWADDIPAGKTHIAYNWSTAVEDDAPPDSRDIVAQAMLRDESVFVIAIVGSLVRWKRQLDAVDATNKLLREGLNVALLIVGPPVDASYAAEIRASVDRANWSERIRLLGYTDHPQRIMRAADVTLVCSDKEPFGRVTVESMAQGTPVIGTDSGGTSEIIRDGVDGLLFPTGDVDALTDRLRTLVQDNGLLTRLSAAAKVNSKRFQSADAAMAPVMSELTALLGRPNPSAPLGTLIGAPIGAPSATAVPSRVRRSASFLMRLVRGRDLG